MWEYVVWDAADKLGLVSGLAMNVAVASGLSAVTYWLAVSEIDGLAAPKLFSQIADMETCISVPVAFLFPVGILFPEQCLFHELPVRVT